LSKQSGIVLPDCWFVAFTSEEDRLEQIAAIEPPPTDEDPLVLVNTCPVVIDSVDATPSTQDVVASHDDVSVVEPVSEPQPEIGEPEPN
jgi:hypothetical protein